MRSSRRFIRLASVAVMLGGLASLTTLSCLALSDEAKTPVAVSAADSQVNFSHGVRDVLKMLDAKVDPGVIKAYVKNAPIAFNPTAAEIIALKQRDVPDDVITSMIQRGAEVRMQLAQSAQAAQAAQAGSPVQLPNTPPPAYDYGTAAPDYYPYNYADYGYPYYGYPYGYGYYGYPYGYGYGGYPYWYGYSYPWAFYSPFYFGFGFHRGFHDFDRFHRFGGFHGNRSFAFQGRPGFGARSPWSPTVGAGFRSSFGHGGFGGRSFAVGGARPGGFGGRMGGFAVRSGGFGGRGGGFGGHGGGGGHR